MLNYKERIIYKRNDTHMKSWNVFKNWITGGCVYFTAIAIFMLLLNFILIEDSASKGISSSAFLMILPCALLLSLAGMLQKVEAIARWARLLLHYALFTVAVFLFLSINSIASPMTLLVLWAVITLLYWLIFLLVHLIRARIRRLLEEDD